MARDSSEIDPKNLPIIAGPSMGEIQMILEEALSNVVWDEGLEHLPSIEKSFQSVCSELSDLNVTMGRVANLLERIVSSLEGLENRS